MVMSNGECYIDEIVVTAPRLDGPLVNRPVFEFFLAGVDFFEDPEGGTVGSVDGTNQDGFTKVTLENGLEVLVKTEELGQDYLNAFLFIANNLEKFPELKSLFDEVKQAGTTSIELRGSDIGPYEFRNDGTVREPTDSDGTGWNAIALNHQQGSRFIITVDTGHTSTISDKVATLVHEFVHILERDEIKTQARESVVMDDMNNIDPFFDLDIDGYSNANSGTGDGGNNHLAGNSGRDDIRGNSGNDQLFGKSGDDVLTGGSGNDKLFGADGDDILIAGAGFDELFGAAGNDAYVLNADITGTIGDTSGAADYLQIETTSNVWFARSQDALVITDLNTNQQLTVFNWFNGQKIETVSLANGTVLSWQDIDAIVESIGGGGGGVIPPIVLDLDGDGIELVSMASAKVKADFDGDGKKESTGWVAPDDGILMFDANGNEKFDGPEEITFTQYLENPGTDLDGLATFDDNGDGRITAEDDIYDQLFVWKDTDQNGHSAKKELFTLEELGITAINLNGTSEISELEGNIVFGYAEFEYADGTTGTLADVGLRSNANGYIWQDPTAEHLAIVEWFDNNVLEGTIVG